MKVEVKKIKKICYLVFILFSCNEVNNNIPKKEIKFILIKDYQLNYRSNPILIFYNASHNVDTNYFQWSFEILTNKKTLDNIYEETKLFKNNLSDITYKNYCHLEVYYENEKKIESIEIPMEKGVEYFDMIIKILVENKIKDLEIAVKKLNYMKD